MKSDEKRPTLKYDEQYFSNAYPKGLNNVSVDTADPKAIALCNANPTAVVRTADAEFEGVK